MEAEVTQDSGRRVVRHNINSYAMHNGFIGALYDNELYEVATGTAEARQRYHAFGVILNRVVPVGHRHRARPMGRGNGASRRLPERRS
jgi:hypothetical protein